MVIVSVSVLHHEVSGIPAALKSHVAPPLAAFPELDAILLVQRRRRLKTRVKQLYKTMTSARQTKDLFIVLPSGPLANISFGFSGKDSPGTLLAMALGASFDPLFFEAPTDFQGLLHALSRSAGELRSVIILGHGAALDGTLSYGNPVIQIPLQQLLLHIGSINFHERMFVPECECDGDVSFDTLLNLLILFKELNQSDKLPIILGSCYSHLAAPSLNALNGRRIIPVTFYGSSSAKVPETTGYLVGEKGGTFNFASDLLFHEELKAILSALKGKDRTGCIQWLDMNCAH